MNREIKFRFWHTVDKEWVSPVLIEFEYESPDAEHIGIPIYLYGKENVEQNIIYQQYTGLKDKDGKEIYEGDILKTERLWSMTGVVAFEEGGFSLKSNDEFYYLNQICGRSTEVIGNIFGM
jgi:uncharacterized phage protein (TIGR01671 family)